MDANSFFNIGNLIAGILTIGIVSFLYKDNPLYKFCEALFVGISAGYWLVTIIFTVILPKLYTVILPVVIVVALLTVFLVRRRRKR